MTILLLELWNVPEAANSCGGAEGRTTAITNKIEVVCTRMQDSKYKQQQKST
jgi:hypothetical protein